MRRDQKAQQIDEIAAHLGEAEAIYAVDYRGLSVPQAAELRANLREHDAYFRVVKNTLTLLAADKAGVAEIKELVAEGPTALTFVRGDAALAAKVLDTFSRQADVLEVKGGLMGGPRAGRRTRSASWRGLPSRDVLDRPVRRRRGVADHRPRARARLAARRAWPWRWGRSRRRRRPRARPSRRRRREAPAEEAPAAEEAAAEAGGRGPGSRGRARTAEPDSDSDSDAEKEAQ